MVVRTLKELSPGETGVVIRISGSGPVRRRIIDMGIVAGTNVKVEKYAPLGDPIEIKAKNFTLSLRKSEAALIEVETN